jgi:hypothetical protein
LAKTFHHTQFHLEKLKQFVLNKMLVDVNFDAARSPYAPDLRQTLRLLSAILGGGNESGCTRLATGVYQAGDSNFDDFLGLRDYEMKYPKLQQIGTSESFSPYGVCDKWTQVVKQCANLNLSDDIPYVLFVSPVRKSEQSKSGGWRWHKWGEYIGSQHRECEYLYDEPHVERVYCYHIYRAPEYMIVKDLKNNNLGETTVKKTIRQQKRVKKHRAPRAPTASSSSSSTEGDTISRNHRTRGARRPGTGTPRRTKRAYPQTETEIEIEIETEKVTQPKKNRGSSENTLFVANIPFATNRQQLKSFFVEHNPIAARVVRMTNGRSRGYGFVEFATPEEQRAALNANGKEIPIRNGTLKLYVKVAKQSTETTTT